VTDETKTAEVELKPIHGLVIGGTGDGGERHTLTTAAGLPNITATVVTPIVAIAVSAISIFLATLVATVTAGGTTNIIEFHGFVDLLAKGAVLGGIAAIIDALKNAAALFTKLREKFPLLQV
jgi:hypothetical protein